MQKELTKWKTYIKRNSNVELLRIISMILIVAFHAARIGCTNVEQPFYIYIFGTLFCSWGILGVDIFIIISSYYLIDQEFKSKKIISIAFQTFTYICLYLLLSFILSIYNTHDVVFSCKVIIVHILDGFWEPFWSSRYWFVTAYFFLLLLSPLLNSIIYKIDRIYFKKILYILLFVPIYAQFISKTMIGDVACFCYIYILVGYIKKYEDTKIKKLFNLKNILLLIGCVILGKVIIYFPIPNTIKPFFENTIACTGRHSVIMLLLSLCICFVVFNKKPTYNSFVNKVAAGTLGVYLFHEQNIIGMEKTVDYIFNKSIQKGFLGHGLLFPIQFIALVLFVYIFGLILEHFRMVFIQKPFMKFIDSKFSNTLKNFDKLLEHDKTI